MWFSDICTVLLSTIPPLVAASGRTMLMPSSILCSQCSRSRLTYTVLTLGVPTLFKCLVRIPLYPALLHRCTTSAEPDIFIRYRCLLCSFTRSRLSYTSRPSGYHFCSNALFRSLCIRLLDTSAPLSPFLAVYQVLPIPNSFLTRSRLSYTGRPSGYHFCSNAFFRSLCIRLSYTGVPLSLILAVCQVPFLPI